MISLKVDTYYPEKSKIANRKSKNHLNFLPGMKSILHISHLLEPKAYLYFTHPASSSYGRKKTAVVALEQFWATVLSTENDFSKHGI